MDILTFVTIFTALSASAGLAGAAVILSRA